MLVGAAGALLLTLANSRVSLIRLPGISRWAAAPCDLYDQDMHPERAMRAENDRLLDVARP